MLNGRADSVYIRRHILSQHQAQRAVKLVHRAISFYAQIILANTPAVAQTGSAVVARAGVDVAKPIAHCVTLFRNDAAG